MSEDLARVAERIEEEEEEEIGDMDRAEWRTEKGFNGGIGRRWEGEERKEREEIGTRVEEAIGGRKEGRIEREGLWVQRWRTRLIPTGLYTGKAKENYV